MLWGVKLAGIWTDGYGYEGKLLISSRRRLAEGCLLYIVYRVRLTPIAEISQVEMFCKQRCHLDKPTRICE